MIVAVRCFMNSMNVSSDGSWTCGWLNNEVLHHISQHADATSTLSPCDSRPLHAWHAHGELQHHLILLDVERWLFCQTDTQLCDLGRRPHPAQWNTKQSQKALKKWGARGFMSNNDKTLKSNGSISCEAQSLDSHFQTMTHRWVTGFVRLLRLKLGLFVTQKCSRITVSEVNIYADVANRWRTISLKRK